MDALDEFFATWSEPEAWCDVCKVRPAIHVVLRDTGGKYGGLTSHVRIWDPITQMRVAVCRLCCQQRTENLGQWMVQPVRPPARRGQTHPHHTRLPLHLLHQWVHRLLRRGQGLLRLYLSGRQL